MVMFVFVIYNAIYIPIELSFTPNKPIGQCTFDYFIDFCFILDMCINMRTTYYDTHNELVLDPKAILRNYVCSQWFAIDFLAVFPFDLVVGGGSCGDSAGRPEDSGGFAAFVGLLKTFRLLRLLRFRRELDRLAGANYLRVCVSLSVFLLVAHWVACVWWAVGVFTYDEDIKRADPLPVVCDGLRACSWLRRLPTGGMKLTPDHTRFIQQYLSSFYWSLTTLMKSPSMGPDPVAEKIVATFAIAVGAICYAVFLSTVQNNFQNLTKKAAQKRDQLGGITAFSKTRDVPGDLARKLMKQTTALYEWTSGIKNSQVLLQLPSHLRGSIAIKLYGELTVSGSTLFSKTSQECAKGIAARLQCQVLIVDQILIAKNEACNMLYLLQKGILKVSLDEPGAQELQSAPSIPSAMTTTEGGSPKSRRSSVGGRKNQISFREIVNPGTPIGMIDPMRAKSCGKYPFWVTASKKTFLYQVSQPLLAQALDGFPEDAQQVRKLLVDEQKKLIDSLFATGEAVDPDTPMNLMNAAEAAAEKVHAPEEIPEPVLERILGVEKQLIDSMDALAKMSETIKALPQIAMMLQSSGARAAATIPHESETAK